MAASCAGARLGSPALHQVVGGEFLLHHSGTLDTPTRVHSKCISLPHQPYWNIRVFLGPSGFHSTSPSLPWGYTKS